MNQSQLQWWCSAQGQAWSWTWRPYPGVWLFMAALAALWWRATHAGGARPTGARLAAGIAGLLLVWAALDWPLGLLGTGYLASVHAVQFLLLAMLAPGLLVWSLPPAAAAMLAARPVAGRLLERLARPLVAAVLFSAVMVATHAPAVADRLMTSQAGAFALDAAWLLAGLLFAWPLFQDAPARPRFQPLLRIVYVFFGTIVHFFIGMWLLVSELPQYATYELAPPFPGLSPHMDQQLAGAVFLLIGTPLVFLAMSVIFFRWQGMGEELGAR